MTDLTNRVKNLKQETIDKLNEKYKSLLSLPEFSEGEKVPYVLYIINLSVNYIQEKYDNESVTWKALATLLVKKLINHKRIRTKDDLFEYIDNFFAHKKSESEKHNSNMPSDSDNFSKYQKFLNDFTDSLN